MNKLPIGLGILAWNSGQTLINTLTSYHEHGLFTIVEDAVILFQEFSDTDKMIADHFDIRYIPLSNNIGIGKGFIELADNTNQPYFMTLEHDWNLIENFITTFGRLQSGITLLQDGYECIRYRHRKSPGYPHFSFRHQGNELNYYDEEIGCTSPHLLDAVHWTEHPDLAFGPMIQKHEDYYVTTSRYGNWTNNPCLYRREFYVETVSQFSGDGIALEGNISKWWAQQSFKVAHGEGLFMHKDLKKYGQ
jgi:hypothetical protein